MIIQGLAFYLFAIITVAAAVMVISARNPVHSVLFLILAFFNSAALFVLLGAEFLAAVGDPALIESADQLAAWAGLAPVPRDSGTRTGNLRTPKRYSRRLRRGIQG